MNSIVKFLKVTWIKLKLLWRMFKRHIINILLTSNTALYILTLGMYNIKVQTMLYILMYIAIYFIDWYSDYRKQSKIQFPKKRFTTNESPDICRVDTKRIPEMIEWVNEIENDLELKGYYT